MGGYFVSEVIALINKNKKHLSLLAKQYPTMQRVFTEIINLRAILNLPKGTEHFMSDLHGEHEAFVHILNNCSGVIREKIDGVFGGTLDEHTRSELCTLVYYPEKKLKQLKTEMADMDEWYEETLLQLVEVCKDIASKYTRSKVRKAMPPEYSYILDELLHADYEGENQGMYYQKIMESILALADADGFIEALATLIKRLAVDRLHIVGDIFDRGPRPDIIMDTLMSHHSVDIQWGNHDILWMGAAAGSDACIAAVVCNSSKYGNLDVLEEGYGINLRPLALFAEKTYAESQAFKTKTGPESTHNRRDAALASKIYKAITIILFKLEGQLWRRHPEYGMDDRMLLHRIDFSAGTVELDGVTYPLTDLDMPTLVHGDPYSLTAEEALLVDGLRSSFRHSERLQRHVRFLYSHGGMYKRFNQNLLYHGCIPMNEDGSFTVVELFGKKASGRALMDVAETMARHAYFGGDQTRLDALDGIWYLWCGRNSPLFGRDRMTTFERLFIAEKSTWAERKNPYYTHIQSEERCCGIIREFDLSPVISHIVNGHVPVRAADGENPIKGGGKLIVIDGGFSRAYQKTTGIAGYTLIYNSYALRLSAHKPFESVKAAIEQNMDIHSSTNVFETLSQRMRVMDTDIGQELSEQIYDLSLLLAAYRLGIL